MKKVFLIVLSILARVTIIFFLFILFVVAVRAYQNPVNYIDSVDVIQANIVNQKYAEWMTANKADIDTNVAELDTLQLEVDTLRLWADTLKLEVDTLRLRVDSIQTSRDSICFIYDAAGGQSISATSAAHILIDTEVFEDGIFTHVADVCSVGVNTAGRYEVSYTVSFAVTDPTKLGGVNCYLQKYSGSWSDVPGGRAIDSWLTNSRVHFTLSKVVSCTLSVGDAVAIYVNNGATETAISTVANTVSLYLKKLH